MSCISFLWTGDTSLTVELGRPIKRVSIEFAPHGKPMYATLWRSDGTGLRIHSVMHDVAERVEVGVLSFSPVLVATERETIVALGSAFDGEVGAYKLVIDESGTSAESGVILRASNNHEIVVVASVAPCMLAVGGVLSAPYMFDPEYPLAQYVHLPLTQSNG